MIFIDSFADELHKLAQVMSLPPRLKPPAYVSRAELVRYPGTTLPETSKPIAPKAKTITKSKPVPIIPKGYLPHEAEGTAKKMPQKVQPVGKIPTGHVPHEAEQLPDAGKTIDRMFKKWREERMRPPPQTPEEVQRRFGD